MEVLYLLECGQDTNDILPDAKFEWEYTELYFNRYNAIKLVYDILCGKPLSSISLLPGVDDNSIWSSLVNVLF